MPAPTQNPLLATMPPKKAAGKKGGDKKPTEKKTGEKKSADKGGDKSAGDSKVSLIYLFMYTFYYVLRFPQLKAATAVQVRHILCEKQSRALEALEKIQEGQRFDKVAQVSSPLAP